MPNTPTVSVILPTHVRAHLLGRAVSSALRQTFGDFELIVVNDGGDPDTRAAIAGFDDARIRYLEQPHRGAAAAENHGISMARGRYIAFLDDDDEWLPEKLRVQVERMEKAPPTTGVVYTARLLLENGKKTLGPSPRILRRNGKIHREIVRRDTFVPLVCALVRRECFETVGGFDETLPTSNDYDLWIRMSARYDFELIPHPHVHVHHTPGSLSTSPRRIIEARKMLLRKHEEVFRAAGRGILGFLNWQTGSLLLLEGELEEGRAYLWRGFTAAFWHPLYAASLIMSLLGCARYVRWYLQPVRKLRHAVRSLRTRFDYLSRAES